MLNLIINMDFASIIVIILRLIVPVSILRYPLVGIIICIVLDLFEGTLVYVLGGEVFGGGVISYHFLDKLLDIYYLSFAFFVALRWKVRLVRISIISLFSIRLIGTLLFLFTGFRLFLLLFPNIFELFFIYCLVANKWFPQFYPKSLSKLLIILIILGLPKLALEYLIHYKQITFIQFIDSLFKIETPVWDWIKILFLQKSA